MTGFEQFAQGDGHSSDEEEPTQPMYDLASSASGEEEPTQPAYDTVAAESAPVTLGLPPIVPGSKPTPTAAKAAATPAAKKPAAKKSAVKQAVSPPNSRGDNANEHTVNLLSVVTGMATLRATQQANKNHDVKLQSFVATMASILTKACAAAEYKSSWLHQVVDYIVESMKTHANGYSWPSQAGRQAADFLKDGNAPEQLQGMGDVWDNADAVAQDVFTKMKDIDKDVGDAVPEGFHLPCGSAKEMLEYVDKCLLRKEQEKEDCRKQELVEFDKVENSRECLRKRRRESEVALQALVAATVAHQKAQNALRSAKEADMNQEDKYAAAKRKRECAVEWCRV